MAKNKNIAKGDLLKSNPISGYWTCSVVLSFQPKSNDFSSLCHVASTNMVFRHDFDFADMDTSKLKIININNNETNVVPCIEVYASKLTKGLVVMSQLKVDSLYSHPLKFEIGNGSDGGWPFCGALGPSLGYQAVHQWRAVNDRSAWLKDIADAERSHAAMLERPKRK